MFNVHVSTLLDTGASVTVVNPDKWGISPRQLAQLRARLEPVDLTITVASGEALPSLGWIRFHLTVRGTKAIYVCGLWVPGSRHACVVGMKTLQEEKFGMQLNKNGNREIWFGKGRRVLVEEPPVLSTMAHLQRPLAPLMPTQSKCPSRGCPAQAGTRREAAGGSKGLAWCAEHHPLRQEASKDSGTAAEAAPRRQCVLQGCNELAEEGTCPLNGGSKLACSQPHYALWKKTAKREEGARLGTAQGRAQEGLVTVNQSTLVPGHSTEYVRVSICNALCSVGEVFDFLPRLEFHPRLTLQEGEWQPQAGCDNFVRVVNWGDEGLSIWKGQSWVNGGGDPGRKHQGTYPGKGSYYTPASPPSGK